MKYVDNFITDHDQKIFDHSQIINYTGNTCIEPNIIKHTLN